MSGLLHEPITILILGPMALRRDNEPEPEERTRTLVRLVKAIAGKIRADFSGGEYVGDSGPVIVDGPDESPSSNIIPNILAKIERADLVVIDVTGGRPNVAYEIGLIHALGLPHVFLTSDADPMFYFKNSDCISEFDLTPGFDPGRKGQRTLHDKIRSFLAAANNPEHHATIERFAYNRISEFFDNLPIVDISGPAGIAAGYWINSIQRFTRAGGYFHEPRRLTWQAQPGLDKGEADASTIGGFIAIQPPSELEDNYALDNIRLNEALADLGLRLFDATVQNRGEEDMRPYGGKFLGRQKAGEQGKILTPAIVVEIPSALYALQVVPRILRIDKESIIGRPDMEIASQRRRRFREMIRRFGYLMTIYVRRANDSRIRKKFRFVPLADLQQTLREFNVPDLPA